MSVRVMSLVFEADLPPNEKILLLALADWADDDGGKIFPAQARMATKASVSDRTVRRLLGLLKARLLIQEVVPANRYRPAEYRINLFALRICAGADPLDVLEGGQSVHSRTANDRRLAGSRVDTGDHQGGQIVQPRVDTGVLPSTIRTTSDPSVVLIAASPRVSPSLSPKSRIKFDPVTGGITGVTESDRERWKTIYPAVDLKREQDRAGEWLVNHPEKRRSNIAQFLANWFERSQDNIAKGRKASATQPEQDWLKKPYGGKFD